jgi:hypothetical protein
MTPASAPLLAAQPKGRVDPSRRLAPDEVAWNLLRGVADADQLNRFVEQFPQSPHRADAVAILSKAGALRVAP